MEDSRIVELYWQRQEAAIDETVAKYDRYLTRISFGILHNDSDAQECVNDTYHAAWNAMPPHRPTTLSTFLGKLTRRISIDRLRKRMAEKRGGGELQLVLDELAECVGENDLDRQLAELELMQLLRSFLDALPDTERRVFLRRYWYLDSIDAICKQFGFSYSKVTSMLHRTRQRLRAQLKKEGYE